MFADEALGICEALGDYVNFLYSDLVIENFLILHQM